MNEFKPGDILVLKRARGDMNAPVGSHAIVLPWEAGELREWHGEPLIKVDWLRNIPFDGGQSVGGYYQDHFDLLKPALSMPDTRDYLAALTAYGDNT